MRTLIDFSVLQEYNDKVLPRGDKLSALASLVDWNAFLSIEHKLYKNKSERGGRPNISIIIMIKLLILQQLYGLSDPQLELQVADRFSFPMKNPSPIEGFGGFYPPPSNEDFFLK